MRAPLPRPGLLQAAALAIVLSGNSLACQSGSETVQRATAQPAAAPPAAVNPRTQTYGAKIGSGREVSLAEVLKTPGTFAGKALIVAGSVRKACSRKGCWLELGTSSEPTAPGCRVTFKDYAFFVPTDSAGTQAKVAGTLETETIEAGHVKHLEEEGANFSGKRPDGTALEVRFVATGVELTKS